MSKKVKSYAVRNIYTDSKWANRPDHWNDDQDIIKIIPIGGHKVLLVAISNSGDIPEGYKLFDRRLEKNINAFERDVWNHYCPELGRYRLEIYL